MAASQNAPVESGRVSTDCAILVPRRLLALPTFSALRISELLNIVMLFSLQMQPTLSHVPWRLLTRSFGQTARPKASLKCLQDSRPRLAFFIQCWKVLDHGPHGFPRIRGTATRMLSPTYWHPSTWPDSEARRCASPHIFYTSWIQEAPLKGLEGGNFGIYIRTALLRQMDAKRPRHPTPPQDCKICKFSTPSPHQRDLRHQDEQNLV